MTKSRARDHEFDLLCTAPGIEHCLTKPRHLQTNGMVGHFDGRTADVLATNRFDSALDLALTIERYLWLYNHPIPWSAEPRASRSGTETITDNTT